MKPMLRINGHDYTEYLEELSPTRNDLDAEGSGRDLLSGKMFRTRIGIKQKWEVKLGRLFASVHRQLVQDIFPPTYSVTILDPQTNTEQTIEVYTSTVQFGVQRFNKTSGESYYDGMTFTMTEV